MYQRYHLPSLLQRSNFSLIFVLGLLILLSLSGCGGEDETEGPFSSPYATFKTRQQALAAKDFDLLWSCLSTNYKMGVYKGDFETWKREWSQKGDGAIENELRREVTDERLINQRIGYLLFDTSTLDSSRASPFFYFIREPEGWKVTTFLDSVFHQELEQAISRGKFLLPHN